MTVSSDEKTLQMLQGQELTSPDDRNKVYPAVIVALPLSNFLIALVFDPKKHPLSTAVPRITDEVHAIGSIGWYGSAYLLTVACCQLLFGKLYTILSIKYTFLAAIVVFKAGSLICGLAPNSTALTVGRAIAGIDGGGVFSGVFTDKVAWRWCFYINLP